jgi:hypothetical protein
MKTLINETFAAAFAAIATLAFVAPAEARRDTHERAPWAQTARNQAATPAYAAPVREGRNAATVAPAAVYGVEPYIARQIEANRRSSR